MSLALHLSNLKNPKLRAARKLARRTTNEAKKLLRRARAGVPQEARDEIEAVATRSRETLQTEDVALIKKATEKLAVLLNKHLDRYRKPAWRESAESILIAVMVALLLRSFVVEAFKIPSGSMIPTLAIGDQIFVNKFVYGIRIPFTSIRLVDFSMPERGDVIVFIYPKEPHEDYIKRVIALPGDEVAVRDGVVYVNGDPFDIELKGHEQFLDRSQVTGEWYGFEAFVFEERIGDEVHTVIYDYDADPSSPAADFGPVSVPEESVFVMGDNRDHSHDSRAWGMVPLSHILGRSLFVWWSWGRDGLATDRIGTWIK